MNNPNKLKMHSPNLTQGNLARIREERHDPEGALREYALVGPGPDYLPAQLRQADILIANGRGSEASRLLAEAREAQPDYAVQLYLIESESYSNNNKDAQADQVLQVGGGLCYPVATEAFDGALAEQPGRAHQQEQQGKNVRHPVFNAAYAARRQSIPLSQVTIIKVFSRRRYFPARSLSRTAACRHADQTISSPS